MKKSIIIASILIIALCACGQKLDTTPAMSTLTVIPSLTTSLIPTGTVTLQPKNTETPWPTLIYYLYPTITPDPDKVLTPPVSTITAPPPRKPPIELPYGLEMEEYQITEKDVYTVESLVSSRHLNRGGWHYWPKGGIIDGKLFQAELGYDEVKLTYCCMSYHPPQHYENLITFYAVKNGQLYYVAIGLFDG